MKKNVLTLLVVAVIAVAAVALATSLSAAAPAVIPEFVHPDGTYRGGYIDPAQVEVQFSLAEGKFTEVKFRALGYRGDDYLKTEDATLLGIKGQYEDLAAYLVDKDIAALQDLYHPEEITEDIDAFSAATLRSAKFISAVNDGLNRGLYALPEE